MENGIACGIVLIIWAAAIAFMSAVTQFLWNNLLAANTDLPEISFWVALVLYLFLTSVFRVSGSSD